VPEIVQYEESIDDGTGRGTRTVVTSVIAVLVIITGTLIGIVLARDPNPKQTSAIDAEHPALPSVIQEPTSTDRPTGPAPNLNPDPHGPSRPDAGGTRPLIQVAPALAGRTGVSEVTALLHRYFTAINDKDRSSWEASLVPRTGPGLDWDGLATTTDAQVTLSALDMTSTPVHASVSFVSHQAPENGNGSACTNWSIVYPLTEYAGGLRIDQVHQEIISRRACPD
jgi:hypothetical protein